jgi:hypothetical protein
MTYATVRANVSPVREHALHVRPMFLIPASHASMWLSAAASSLRRSRRAMRYPRSIPFASKLKPARLMCYGADNLQMYRHVRCDTGPQRRKASRPAGHAVYQIRVRHQPADGKGRSAMTLLRRYSCDRPKPSASLAAVQESGFGTNRTCRADLTMSVDGGRAEVGGTRSNRRD